MSEELLKIVEYSDIGKVRFVRKNSVRNLKITIKPFKGVQVTFPRSVSLEHAGRFVDEKRLWIKQSQQRLRKIENKTTLFGEDRQFSTKDHILILERHDRHTIKTVIGKGHVYVIFPNYANVQDPRVQGAIRKAIVNAWRIEAKKYLPERVELLSREFKLSYNRVSVRDNKSRWGSCSRDNSISLNIHLMRLPQHLCDYIILHELAHTIHRHHQKSFWLFLDQLTGGLGKKLDREMIAYNPEIW